MKILRLLVFCVLFIGANHSWGQVVTLGTINSAYTQNFDSLERSAGTSSFMPYGWKFNETGSNANTTYSPSTGSAAGGNTYSLGLSNNSDRALGGLQSSSLVPSWGAIFKNSTGSNITSIDVAYKAETWRVGTNNRKDSITFQYNLTGTDITTGTWVTVSGLGYANPGRTANSGGLVSDSSNVSFTITGLNISSGTTFAIRFLDYDATSSDDAIGVDDFSFTPKSATTNTIALGSISPSTYCPGVSISIPFTSTGTFTGNTYTAQISNGSGSFASPATLGTLASNANSGTISGTVPTGLAAGSGYKVRVISSGPGATSDTGSVTIRPIPVFSPAAPSFCPNATSTSVTVSNATGGTFGSPSGAATGVSVTGSDPNYTVAPGATTGTRTYTYTASNTCTADLVVTVASPPPAPTFTSSTTTRNVATTCSNASSLTYQVTSVASTTWAWTLPSGWTYTQSTNTITITAIGVSGNVSVTATVGGCTSSVTNFAVTVNQAPSNAGTVSGPNSVCSSSTGNVFSVVNTSGVTYAWSVSGTGWSIPVASTTNSVTVTAGPSANGSVTVVPSQNGCSASSSVKSGITVVSTPSPQVRISAPVDYICAGATYTFTATPTDGGNNPTYQWKVNGSNVASTSSTYTGSLNSGDYISCTITNTDCGSASANSNLLFARKLSYNPTLAWAETFGTTGGSTNVTAYNDYSFLNKSQFTITPASSVDVRTSTASPSGGANMFFNASASSRTVTISGLNTQNFYPNKLTFEFYKTGSIVIDSSNFLVEVSPNGTDFYPMPFSAFGNFAGRWDSIVFYNGLPRSNSLSLRFSCDVSGGTSPRIDNIRLFKYDTTAIGINASSATSFCTGGSVTLTANPVNASFSYAWTGGSTSSSISASLSNTYNLTVTDTFGCSANASQLVVVSPLVTYYKDADNDGYSDGTTQITCTGAPANYKLASALTATSGDCNDSNAGINPGATEICGNGIDENCNGSDLLCSSAVWTPGGSDLYWHNPANWSTNSVPNNCGTDVYIPATLDNPHIDISETFSVGDLTFEGGNQPQITLGNLAVLNVCGDITVQPSIYNEHEAIVYGYGSRVILNGTAQQNFSGTFFFTSLRLDNASGAKIGASDTVGLNTLLELKQGNLDATDGAMLLASDNESQCAVLDNFSSGFTGTISGDVIAERGYESAINTYTQHYFSSPINNVAITQFAPASGTNGVSITPTADCDETQLPAGSNYGNVFEYNEGDVTTCHLQAWKVRSSGSATNARGYSVVKSGFGYLKLKGRPNLSSTYTLTGLNNSGWSLPSKQTTAGSLPNYQGGWHLVGNPYSALLDPSSVANSSFDNTALVLHTFGSFAGTYQPLSLSSTATVAPFQAFFVRKSSTIGSAAFTISASERRVGQTVFYKNEERQMSITATAGDRNDITYVSFNTDATADYDPMFDGLKFTSGGGAPTIYTNIDDNIASVNTNPDVASTPTIPMGFMAGKDTTYSLKAEGIENLPTGTEVILEDKLTGAFQQLNTSPVYTFTSAKADNINRFVLHFAKIETPNGIGNINQKSVSIFGNGDKVFVDLSKANATGAKVTIYNLLGEVLSNETATANMYSRAFNNVETTCLIVVVKTMDGITTKKVILTGK